jgi:hypothetical protein
MAFSACNCDTTVKGSGDGVVLVEPAGQPDEFERTVDLGSIRVSELKTQPIKLLNKMRVAATITKFELTEDSSKRFFLKLPSNSLPRLQALEEYDAELRYMPDQIGSDEGTVIIETDAPLTPKYIIHVRGEGGASIVDACSTDNANAEICVSTAPDNRLLIDLGAVKPGSESTKPLVIKSGGSLPLNIKSIQPGYGSSPDFSVADTSKLPKTIEGNAHEDFTISFKPQVGGLIEGSFEIITDDPITPRLVVYVKGTGLAPHLCIDPLSLDFGETDLGKTVTKQIKITSCGAEAATITGFVLTDGGGMRSGNNGTDVFAVPAPPSTPVSLGVNEQITVDVAYKPLSFGGDSGKIRLDSTAPGQEHGIITLAGSGVGCTLSAPATVAFGNVSNGGKTSKIVQVTNRGTGVCSITALVQPNAPFAIDNFMVVPGTIDPGQSEALTISFAPTANQPYTGSIVFKSNNAQGDVTVNLTGTGIPRPACDLQANPTAVFFANISPGQTAVQNVILTNYGTDECYISKGELKAGSSTAFKASVAGFPPSSIASGGTFKVPVTFAPTTAGQHSGTLHIEYGTDPCPIPIPGLCPTPQVLDVDLKGGTLEPKVCIAPTTLDYGTVASGTQKDMSFTITSCGQGTLSLRGLKMEAGTSKDYSFPTAVKVPQFIPAGQAITVNVRYAPKTNASDFGQVMVLSNDPNLPKGYVTLRGNAGNVCATQIACSTDKLVFPTMEVGRSSSLSVVCTNVGNQPATVNGVGLSGGSSSAFTVSMGRTPQTIQPGGTFRVEVNYVPQVAGADNGTIVFNSNSCDAQQVAVEGTGRTPNYPPCLPPQTFTPVTKWDWQGGTTQPDSKNVAMAPIVLNLDDDNGDGRIDENDIPEIIFTSCRSSECCINCLNVMDFSTMDLAGKGMLRAVHGKDGSAFWNVTDPNLALGETTQIAGGDIDGDNVPEIIAVKRSFQKGSGDTGMTGKYKSGKLLVFNNFGQLLFETEEWTGDPDAVEFTSAPTLGDLDSDGKVEIVFERTVFRNDGTKWFDMAKSGNDGHGSMPSLSDLNGDGFLEIVSGKYAFKNDGTPYWTASQKYNGPTMILDTDADGLPDVVLRDSPQSFVILDATTGTKKYGPVTWPPPPKDSEGNDQSICSAPMAGADLDGDGAPEIIVPAGDKIYAFKANGTKMWEQPINDYGGQCGAAGVGAFDFSGQGKYSAVYHDTSHMYVFDGPTGNKLYDAPRNSSTIWETPVIADVDNDGHADFVMTNENGFLGIGVVAGIRVLSNTGNNWPATRRIWNQHSYHISDVNDNGSIPRVEQPSWKTNNSWRAQKPLCRK